MTTLRWLSMVLLAAACGNTSGMDAPPLEPGTYALVSINANPIPTREACTNVTTDEARFVVDDARGAQYFHRGTDVTSGKTLTTTGTGGYTTRFDGSVVVRLTAVTETGTYDVQTQLQRTSEGLTEIAGVSCDGRDVRLYRLQR